LVEQWVRWRVQANYYRSVDEFTAPFAADGAATKAGLRLRTIDTRVVPCPYHAAWTTEPDNGGRTAEEHGACASRCKAISRFLPRVAAVCSRLKDGVAALS
jgi:hypothetical protein